MMHSTMKLLIRQKSLLCYLAIIWGIAMLFSSTLIGNWTWSRAYIQQLPEVRHSIIKHHSLVTPTHPKLNRAVRYCNLGGNIMKGQEANPRKNDHLESVVIVTRHGDRNALNEIRNLTHSSCGFSLAQHPHLSDLIRLLHDAEQLQLARGAFAQFPLLPPLDSRCLPGQLSAKGLLQMLQLGQQLRSAYEKLIPVDRPLAYSTSVTRTYQSLLAFLYGFQPSFNVSDLAIRAGLGFNFCHQPPLCDCPLLERLNQQVRNEQWNHLKSHPAVQGLVKTLNSIIKGGGRNHDLAPPDELFDTLIEHICHEGDLPCHPNDASMCATADHVNNVLGFLEWSGKQMASFGPFKRSSRLRIHGFLIDLAQKLNSIKHGKQKDRIFVYSAHDVTMVPLLSAFGFFDGSKVPYASRLVIELYSTIHPLQVRLFHIKVLYNGKDMTRKVIFCQNATGNLSGDRFSCPLNNFLHYVGRDFFVEMKTNSFKKACSI